MRSLKHMTVQAFWEPIRRHIPVDSFVSTAVRTLSLTLACVYYAYEEKV